MGCSASDETHITLVHTLLVPRHTLVSFQQLLFISTIRQLNEIGLVFSFWNIAPVVAVEVVVEIVVVVVALVGFLVVATDGQPANSVVVFVLKKTW